MGYFKGYWYKNSLLYSQTDQNIYFFTWINLHELLDIYDVWG